MDFFRHGSCDQSRIVETNRVHGTISLHEHEKTRGPSTRIPNDRDHGEEGFEPPFRTDCDDSSRASRCSSGLHDILRGERDT